MGPSAYDPLMIRKVLAIVYGPTLSEALQSVFNRTVASTPLGQQLNSSPIAAALKVAREEGADVDSWLKGRMLMTVLGPSAEAIGVDLESCLGAFAWDQAGEDELEDLVDDLLEDVDEDRANELTKQYLRGV